MNKKCGKIFVATSNQEISYLDKILKQANSNGLNDLREISHKNINNNLEHKHCSYPNNH